MLDMRTVVPIESMRGDDDADTEELRRMYDRARRYVESRSWCSSMSNPQFGFGVGGVVSVFLFWLEIRNDPGGWHWIVVGDLPSMVFVTDRAPNPAAALETYAELGAGWVQAVLKGEDLRRVYRVDAPADIEHARLLENRIGSLRRFVIPEARRRMQETR